MKTAGLSFRPLRPADQAKLWEWLHIALWDPPPAGLRPREVLDSPAVRIYAEEWGRPTDVGVVAQMDGRDIGACWMRLLAAGVGFGSVDERTPQLGIALEPAHQHKGYGRELMLAALEAARAAGYRQVSLTVHPLNPAIRVYERCGFTKLDVRNTYHLMVAPLQTPYELVVEPREGFLHARVTGERTPGNALRFLKEAHDECVRAGHTRILLEMRLTGPSLPAAEIFRVISARSAEGAKLSRIAYVEASMDDPLRPRFAETVAINRAVNVRLFRDVAAAERWLEGG